MRIGKLLCKIGLHDWKLSNGIGVTAPHGVRMLITFDKDCRRCGKHEQGEMLA